MFFTTKTMFYYLTLCLKTNYQSFKDYKPELKGFSECRLGRRLGGWHLCCITWGPECGSPGPTSARSRAAIPVHGGRDKVLPEQAATRVTLTVSSGFSWDPALIQGVSGHQGRQVMCPGPIHTCAHAPAPLHACTHTSACMHPHTCKYTLHLS